MPFSRQKSLAAYNHHPLQQPTLSLSAPGSASTSPPCTPFFHSVALLPGLSHQGRENLQMIKNSTFCTNLILQISTCFCASVSHLCLSSTNFLKLLCTILPLHHRILELSIIFHCNVMLCLSVCYKMQCECINFSHLHLKLVMSTSSQYEPFTQQQVSHPYMCCIHPHLI